MNIEKMGKGLKEKERKKEKKNKLVFCRALFGKKNKEVYHK
jgi:hypothetical protein